MKAQKFSLLIVDDDEHDRFFLERAFQKLGAYYRIHALTDGSEAIAFIKGEGNPRANMNRVSGFTHHPRLFPLRLPQFVLRRCQLPFPSRRPFDAFLRRGSSVPKATGGQEQGTNGAWKFNTR